MDECARIMLEEVAAHSRNPSSIREVRFVLLGADAEAAFRAEADRQLAPTEQSGDEDRGEKGQRHGR